MASPGEDPRRARNIDAAGPESVWASPADPRDRRGVPPEALEGLRERLLAVCGEVAFAELSRLTGTHRESIRRFLNWGKPPSASFLAALCSAGQISAEWLLCGRGRPLYSEPGEGGFDAEADLAAIQERLGRAIDAREGARPRRRRARG